MRPVRPVSSRTLRDVDMVAKNLIIAFAPVAILYKLKLGEIVTTIPTIGEYLLL